MGFTRILWDELIEGYIQRVNRRKNLNDIESGILYVLMALKDMDGRISDLEEQHSEIKQNLKPSDNSDFIQFLEDLEIPQAPSNSPNKTEFHNGAVIMKDIILKKLKSLSRG